MGAANQVSQRLSYSSTRRNAGGLNFRVRDGYGCNPTAMAAVTPIRGIEPRPKRVRDASIGDPMVTTALYVQSRFRLDPYHGSVYPMR